MTVNQAVRTFLQSDRGGLFVNRQSLLQMLAEVGMPQGKPSAEVLEEIFTSYATPGTGPCQGVPLENWLLAEMVSEWVGWKYPKVHKRCQRPSALLAARA